MTDLMNPNSTIIGDHSFDIYTLSATLEDLYKGITVRIGDKLVRFKKIFDHDKSLKKLLIKTNILLGATSAFLFLLPSPLSVMGIMPLGCMISHTLMYWNKKRKNNVS